MSIRKHPRGSIMSLAIVVSVVLTALITAMSLCAGEASQRAGAMAKADQAYYAAESGLQRVTWYCKAGQMSSISSPLTGTVNGFTYSVSWSTVSGSTLAISSVATSGITLYTLSAQVTPPVTTPATIQSMGDFNNKNIDVTGDVLVGGDYSNGGSGSLTGNLTYYGSASGTGDVSGTITHASGTAPPIDFTTLGTTLIAAAGQTYSGNQSNKTFNFDALPGTNKVIYVDGNVSNPTFVGTGTLYVKGTIHTDAYGSAASPVNLVATGDITTSNNITMYGSIYTNGDWNRGKFNLTGLVYTTGIVKSNNGASSLTMESVPWFDPRVVAGSGGSSSTPTTITKFSGPQP